MLCWEPAGAAGLVGRQASRHTRLGAIVRGPCGRARGAAGAPCRPGAALLRALATCEAAPLRALGAGGTNWCSYVVTSTLSCHVQNGTYLQRVLQNCPWPVSCPGNSYRGFPGGSVSKESACDAADPGLSPGSGRSISWRRKWQPTPVFLSRESHGQRSLVGYSPRGRGSRTRLSDSYRTGVRPTYKVMHKTMTACQ